MLEKHNERVCEMPQTASRQMHGNIRLGMVDRIRYMTLASPDTIINLLTMLWELILRDLRRWVPQERVTQLRIRLWSALVIFSFGCLKNINNVGTV